MFGQLLLQSLNVNRASDPPVPLRFYAFVLLTIGPIHSKCTMDRYAAPNKQITQGQLVNE